MSLPIISAQQRMAERKGVKLLMLGKSGIGKTTRLKDLDPKTTLFIDIEFSIPESRFNALPPAWRDQFAPARTVKPGKQSFKLSFDGGEA